MPESTTASPAFLLNQRNCLIRDRLTLRAPLLDVGMALSTAVLIAVTIKSAYHPVFVLATEHTLLRIFLNIWRQILFTEDLHDDAPKNSCTTECGTLNCPHVLHLAARLSNYQCTFT